MGKVLEVLLVAVDDLVSHHDGHGTVGPLDQPRVGLLPLCPVRVHHRPPSDGVLHPQLDTRTSYLINDIPVAAMCNDVDKVRGSGQEVAAAQLNRARTVARKPPGHDSPIVSQIKSNDNT